MTAADADSVHSRGDFTCAAVTNCATLFVATIGFQDSDGIRRKEKFQHFNVEIFQYINVNSNTLMSDFSNAWDISE